MKQEIDDKIVQLISEKKFEKSFRMLLKEFKKPLYFKLREMLPSHSDADDVLQNTFIKVWRNIEKFEGKSKIYSWCYRIAINESLQWIAKQKNHQLVRIEDEEKYVDIETGQIYLNGEEIQIMLEQAVATLPEKQKQIFQMKYFKDMKYSEIANELNTSTGGLKANYHHAVKKIEAFIKLQATN